MTAVTIKGTAPGQIRALQEGGWEDQATSWTPAWLRRVKEGDEVRTQKIWLCSQGWITDPDLWGDESTPTFTSLDDALAQADQWKGGGAVLPAVGDRHDPKMPTTGEVTDQANRFLYYQ